MTAQRPDSWGDRLPTLPGERLVLRALEDRDLEALLAVFGDPEVMRYWSTSAWEHLAEAEEYLASIRRHFAERSLFQWGIADRASDEVFGTCTLFHLELLNRRAEMGIILGRKSWGRGLGSEALATLIGFAFRDLELHRLEADVDPNNARSLKLFEGQGFVREGLLRERWFVHGEIQDTVLLGLLAREWKGGG